MTPLCRVGGTKGWIKTGKEFTLKLLSGGPGKGLERRGLWPGWKQGTIRRGISEMGSSRLSLAGR